MAMMNSISFLLSFSEAREKLAKWREETARCSGDIVEMGELLLTQSNKLGDEGRYKIHLKVHHTCWCMVLARDPSTRLLDGLLNSICGRVKK